VSEDSPPNTNSPAADGRPDARRWKALGVLALVQFMLVLDTTVVRRGRDSTRRGHRRLFPIAANRGRGHARAGDHSRTAVRPGALRVARRLSTNGRRGRRRSRVLRRRHRYAGVSRGFCYRRCIPVQSGVANYRARRVGRSPLSNRASKGQWRSWTSCRPQRRGGKVEQPARRDGIRANGVEPVRRHQGEVSSDDRRGGIELSLSPWTERPIRCAADIELRVAGEEELATRAWPRASIG
jgi:hypothetical protein